MYTSRKGDLHRRGAAQRRGIRTLLVLILGTIVCAISNLSGPASASDIASSADALRTGWDLYKARFVAADGRVLDNANGDVSHSEGQGFGMLLAVAVGDEPGFARIWGWTARELYRRDDGLASWRWTPKTDPHVQDPNNATDGDLLIAWALLRAAKRWNNAEYRAAARRIALAVGRHAVFPSRLGPVLKPAVSGFGATEMADGPVVNLSYWVFPALADLPEVAPEIDWNGVIGTGLALLAEARFGPAELPSDWISLAGKPLPAKAFPPVFGYDAVRIPLYLAWSGFGKPDLYAPFLRLVQDGAAPSVVNLATGHPTAPLGEAGYRAGFELVACAADADAAGGTDDRIPLGIDRDYYPSSLRLLAALAARDRNLPCRFD